MTDSIDDLTNPEPAAADIAPPEIESPDPPQQEPIEPHSDAAESHSDVASAFTSGFQSPGEPSPPIRPTPPAPARRPLTPYRLEAPLPGSDAPTSPPPGPTGLHPSPPIERVVRPIEPFAPQDEPPPAKSTATPRPLTPRLPYYAKPEPPQAAPKRWPVALLAFSSGLLGALLVLGGLALGGVFDEEVPAPTTTVAPVAATAPPQTVIVREVIAPEGSEGVATAVGEKVVPSIVTVEVGSGDATGDFSTFGSGSGVVFSEDGLILTNHHVIDGAVISRVIFQDGRIYEASIIGSDELTDLAVLRIEATGLVPVELGTTDALQIGDRAIAVGNPLGLAGGASLTVGVVSAFDREVDTGDATPLFGMLQTDAPITNGSSGGALVDAEGKLIGITTAIGVSASGAEGIGFATPVEVVSRIADQIIETGDVAHAFLGVQLRTNFAIQNDGAAVPTGAIVAGFGEGPSAAADAGLQADDVIVSWNGNSVRTLNDLINGIRRSDVGEEITLVVKRGGETLEFSVTLGQRPEGV